MKITKVVLAALLAALPLGASAQQKLKFAHVYETSEPYHVWAVWAAGEIAKRRAAWKAPEPPKRGYYKLYVEHVQQADKGADLDFLVGGSGTTVTRDSH